MNYWSFLAMFASFLLSIIVCPKIIPILKKLKFGQNERLEGNPEHLKKQGTPTMGALGFLPAIVLVSLVFGFVFFDVSELKKWLPVLLLTIGFGAIGFADDYLKVVKKQNEGFKPKQKLFCQFVLAAGFTAYCFFTPEIGSEVILPFSGGKTWDMKWLYLPFALIAVLGTDNGTNLTDGVDGLMSSVTVVTSIVLMVMSERLGGGVSYLSGAVAGALMGFLF
ncbi:MAG: phospho-N-acetylmuramoyl-pentapeptide-transferase, partial [Lachnospiraceae bacterium]|nr:phospho-N-acetylmuramoyl-pentapeptide-transferase [Lachnospiraceae bacterium]